MMDLLTHRWLSSDERFVFVSLQNKRPAPSDKNLIGQYHRLEQRRTRVDARHEAIPACNSLDDSGNHTAFRESENLALAQASQQYAERESAGSGRIARLEDRKEWQERKNLEY